MLADEQEKTPEPLARLGGQGIQQGTGPGLTTRTQDGTPAAVNPEAYKGPFTGWWTCIHHATFERRGRAAGCPRRGPRRPPRPSLSYE